MDDRRCCIACGDLQAPSGLLAALGLESDPKKVVFVGRAVYDYLVEVCGLSTNQKPIPA
jgi:hypothetical protein